jgi:hypothetical protein
MQVNKHIGASVVCLSGFYTTTSVKSMVEKIGGDLNEWNEWIWKMNNEKWIMKNEYRSPWPWNQQRSSRVEQIKNIPKPVGVLFDLKQYEI